MENSIHLEREKKWMFAKVHNDESFNKRMNEIESETLDEIEEILDKKHENTTDWVLNQTDKKVTLRMMKQSSGSIDTFKSRCKRFLMGLLTDTD